MLVGLTNGCVQKRGRFRSILAGDPVDPLLLIKRLEMSFV